MSIIDDVLKFITSKSPIVTVNEWDYGLYVLNGRIIKKKKKRYDNPKELPKTGEKVGDKELGLDKLEDSAKELSKKTDKPKRQDDLSLEQILSEEKKVIENVGGYFAFLPFINRLFKKRFPDGYVCDWITGLPNHPHRYEYNLQAGTYLVPPFFGHIYVGSKQTVEKDLGYVTVPTSDEGMNEPMNISYNLAYSVLDLYRAYLVVQDYDKTLWTHVKTTLSNTSWGMSYKELKTPKGKEELEKKVTAEIRKKATDKWGIKITSFSITDCYLGTPRRVIIESDPQAGLTSLNYLPSVTSDS